MSYRISHVAALASASRVIGNKGDIPWGMFKADMDRFKATTMDHPVIMGRKTWESIQPKYRPLPGRTNIVVTRQQDYVAEGAVVVSSLSEALAATEKAPGADEVFIIGGGEIYEETMPFTHRLYLTLLDVAVDGDTYYPRYEDFGTVVEQQLIEPTAKAPKMIFLTIDR